MEGESAAGIGPSVVQLRRALKKDVYPQFSGVKERPLTG